MTRRILVTLFFPAAIAATVASAQNKNKKSFTFRGKIESLDAKAKTMNINGEKVDGWMEAMTMLYKVDNADVFNTAKVGDRIEATVYDGDFVLYQVRVVADKK